MARRRRRRSTTTVVVHKDGTVTFWSTSLRRLLRYLPESIPEADLKEMSRCDYHRLRYKFGLTKTNTGWRLSSAAERPS